MSAAQFRSEGRRRLRRLLLGALLAIAVVLGTLNACTLGAHNSPTHEAPAASAAAGHAVGHEAGAVEQAAPADAIVIACAMALLAFIVMLTSLFTPRRRRTTLLRETPLRTPVPRMPRARPSLLVLCISRT